jgi:hypothetical protein
MRCHINNTLGTRIDGAVVGAVAGAAMATGIMTIFGSIAKERPWTMPLPAQCATIGAIAGMLGLNIALESPGKCVTKASSVNAKSWDERTLEREMACFNLSVGCESLGRGSEWFKGQNRSLKM